MTSDEHNKYMLTKYGVNSYVNEDGKLVMEYIDANNYQTSKIIFAPAESVEMEVKISYDK